MSEGLSASPPHEGLRHDTLQVTINEPLSPLKKKDSGSSDGRCSSPLGLHKSPGKKDKVGSLAKAFRKVFRSRTPSPSTEDREEDVGSETGEKCDLSSDSESHDSHHLLTTFPRHAEFQESIESQEVTSMVCTSHVRTATNEDSLCDSPKEYLSLTSPGLGKSQTYSALSEVLHHAFLEGMICSGAEDVNVITASKEMHIQGSKSENDIEQSQSIDYSYSSTKTSSYVSSEDWDSPRKESDVPLPQRSLLVPSVSLKSGTFSDHSDVGTDDDSSSQHSRDERQDSVSPQQNEHKPFFGNFFSSSRRSSMIPPSEDNKGDSAAQLSGSQTKQKDNPGEHGKGHKTLGDTLSKVAEVSSN